MIIMGRIKADAFIRQIPGKAYALELCIVRPFRYSFVCQGIQDFLRNLLPTGKVDRAHRRPVHTVSEQKDLKIRTFRIFVYAALFQADGGICLDINFYILHDASYKTGRRSCLHHPEHCYSSDASFRAASSARLRFFSL